MRVVSAGASMARRGVQAAAEAGLLVAIALALLFGVGPMVGTQPPSGADAVAAKPLNGVITVQQPVSHGATTTAAVHPGGANVYVFVQCYTPDFGGEYVYAAYFPVGADNSATIGPLWSTLWNSGGAACRAQEGYFTRNGFGRWVVEAQTTFSVQP